MNTHETIPAVLLTPMAFNAAQEAGVADILADRDIMDELRGLEGMPDALPGITVLRAHSFKDGNFERASPDSPYYPAHNLSADQAVERYERARIARFAQATGKSILEITVQRWDEAQLAEDMVATLYRNRDNASGVHEPVTTTLRNFGRLLNRFSGGGENSPLIGRAEQNRGDNIVVARHRRPYKITFNQPAE